MTGSKLRKILRWIHLFCAVIAGTYIYSPLSDNTVFHLITFWVAVPVLGLTGIGMWKQGTLMGWMNRPNKVTETLKKTP